MKQQKILVTGGAGFLGSNLCEKLLKLGHIVISLDNYLTGDEKNLYHLKENFKNLKIIDHDICLPICLDVDEIYHLACPASPKDYQKDPIETVRINVLGTLNVLNLAKAKGAKVVYTSTSEIYGDPLIHPQKETYVGNVNPIGIRACYDEGKRCSETLCFDFIRKYNLDVRVVRVFNTYGPRMQIDDGRVVSNFIVQALKHEPITIYGNGQQTRSFCYVDDLLDGLILFMEKGNNKLSPLNLGNDTEFTVLELAKLVLNLTKSKSKIIYKKLPQDDPQKRRPDLSKIRESLGWEPMIVLKDGLEKTIKYFSEKI